MKTNSNVSIEALAIFTENVAKLDDSVQLVKQNTENQETIKAALTDLKDSAQKAVEDITGAEAKYTKAIKITVQEVENLTRQFATTTIEKIQNQRKERVSA